MLYTVEQTAQKLNCSRTFVYSLINSGRLYAVRLAPKCVRISQVELERFIKQEGR